MKHCKSCGGCFYEDHEGLWIYDNLDFVNNVIDEITGVGICEACIDWECVSDCYVFGDESNPHCQSDMPNCQTLEDAVLCLIRQRKKELAQRRTDEALATD